MPKKQSLIFTSTCFPMVSCVPPFSGDRLVVHAMLSLRYCSHLVMPCMGRQLSLLFFFLLQVEIQGQREMCLLWGLWLSTLASSSCLALVLLPPSSHSLSSTFSQGSFYFLSFLPLISSLSLPFVHPLQSLFHLFLSCFLPTFILFPPFYPLSHF